MEGNMNNQQQYFDRQLQALFDGINALLSAQTNDQQNVAKAIKQSAELHQSIRTTVYHLAENVPEQIKQAAEESSETIANTVLQRLNNVNEKAMVTAHVFDKATQRLGFKLFGMGVLVLTLCFAMMWLFIMFYVPSLDDIEERRYELAKLNTTIEKLEMLGARAQLATCPINKKSVPCIRTDERYEKGTWGSNGETYRLIWQSK